MRAIITAVLALLVLLVYGQVRSHNFINFDDPLFVSANPSVLGGLTWGGLRWAFTQPHAANWIPITWISHMIDVQLFGAIAGRHLLVSLALHACNSALVFLFVQKATGAVWRSAAVAALFAVHPLHVESVAWISERKDTLSALFFLLCLIAYTRYVQRGSHAAYAASIAFLAIGMLAKPMLVSTPVLLLLLDYWPFRRKAIVEKLPFLLAIAPSAVVTLVAQRQAMPELSNVPPMIRVANAAISYIRYIGKTFWPSRLSVIYPFPNRIAPATAMLCGAILIAITVSVVLLRRFQPWLFVGWFWFVIALIPTIGIVQVGLQSMADRYTYLPHIGFFIAVVWTCAELAPRFALARALPAAAAIVIVSLAIAAHAQAGYWTDNVALFQHALDATSQDNKVAHFNLAAGYMQRGDYSAAEREYRLAGNLPNVSTGRHSALVRAANEEFRTGRLTDAQLHLADALSLMPDDYETRMNYGTLLSQLDRNAEAEEQFRYAGKLRPQAAEPHVYAALVAAKQRRFERAIGDVQQAIAVDHDGSNRILISAIRIQPRPTAIDEYLAFLRHESGGH